MPRRIIRAVRKIDRITKRPTIRILAPALVALYYLCLDIFGDTWSWIRDYPVFHSWVFGTLLVFTVLVAVVQVIAEGFANKGVNDYTQSLHSLLSAVRKIVVQKQRRFKERLEVFEEGSDIFDSITRPRNQITVIAEETREWISSTFGIPSDGVTIKIVVHDNTGWRYLLQSPLAADAEDVLRLRDDPSALRRCIRSGHATFFPCKQKAHDEDNYKWSQRDQETGRKGSIYVYPVAVKTPNRTNTYYINIATYGKRLLDDPDDAALCEALRFLLDEVCERIHLELILWTLKSIVYKERALDDF